MTGSSSLAGHSADAGVSRPHRSADCFALSHASDARVSIEALVKGQDAIDAVALHHGKMECIARGQPSVPEDYGLGSLHRHKIDREDLVHDAKKRLERWMYRLATFNRRVPMKDLLHNLRIRYELLSLVDQPFQEPSCVLFVRVGRAHQVHRDIGVDENHHSPRPT